MGQVRAGGQEMIGQGEHRIQDDTGSGARIGLLWQGQWRGGGDHWAGEITCRFKIATNKHYSCNSVNYEQKFSKETFHTYNTTPVSYEDFNPNPRLRNNLKLNQNHLNATHYGTNKVHTQVKKFTKTRANITREINTCTMDSLVSCLLLLVLLNTDWRCLFFIVWQLFVELWQLSEIYFGVIQLSKLVEVVW